MNVHFIFFTIVIKKRTYSEAELRELAYHQQIVEEIETNRTKYFMHIR